MRTTILILVVACFASLRGWSQTDAEQGRILSLENAWNQAVQQPRLISTVEAWQIITAQTP